MAPSGPAMNSDAGEQAAYDELQCYSLAHPAATFIHQYVVDAWAAQHAGPAGKPVGLAFALIGLYLHLERGLTGREVQRAHMALARRRRVWPAFELPAERRRMTAIDVLAAPAGEARDAAIEAWCASVWAAFRNSHGDVARLAGPEPER